MLALCRSSHQVVVTDEELYGTNMVRELLGKRQCLTYQAGNVLSQRVVEALDVISCAGQFADRPVLRGRNHPFVHRVLIGVKRGVLTVRFRNLRPQSLGTLAAAITHVKGNYLASCGIHGEPNPLLVGLLLDKAGHFIRFHLQASNHDVAVMGDGLEVEMIRQCLNALDQKA
jgi:hypothetical protein